MDYGSYGYLWIWIMDHVTMDLRCHVLLKSKWVIRITKLGPTQFDTIRHFIVAFLYFKELFKKKKKLRLNKLKGFGFNFK